RREEQHRRELREVEHTEQQSRVREPEDEQLGGQVLEPRTARRERVPEEVGAEVSGGDEPEGRSRADRPALRPRLDGWIGYLRPVLLCAGPRRSGGRSSPARLERPRARPARPRAAVQGN